MAKHVAAVEEIAFPELGCESINASPLKKMPLTVCIDCRGGNIFAQGKAKYSKK
jgi:fumarate hydratase subunit beta